MKVYNKDGASMTAGKEQMSILLDAGWSKTKPESKQAKAATPVEEKKEAEAVKPKKIRKVTPKKK